MNITLYKCNMCKEYTGRKNKQVLADLCTSCVICGSLNTYIVKKVRVKKWTESIK